MAPPKPLEEECTCSSSSASPPNTPKRKSNPSTPTPGKRKVAGARTPAKGSPANKNGTPNSAPVRKTTGKKAEPTLLGDFLLGRPSPNRVKNAPLLRRKSLDAVKAEMRANNMARVQAPGKVQDRVKQWQKASAKAGATPVPDLDEILVEVDKSSEESVDEEERRRVKYRGRKTARRKSKTPEEEPPDTAEKMKSSRSQAPPKRVISDSHWMNKQAKAAKGNTIPKNFLQATALNPPVEKKIQDWVQRTESEEREPTPRRVTPEKKRKPRKSETEESEELPKGRKVSRQDLDDGIRVTPSRESVDDGIRIKPSKDRPGERITPSRSKTHDDGIRVTPSKQRSRNDRASSKTSLQDDGIRITPSNISSQDDGIRVTPSKSASNNGRRTMNTSKSSLPDDGIRIRPGPDKIPDDGIRIKPSRDNSPAVEEEPSTAPRESSQRRRNEYNEDSPTPRKRSEKHLKVSNPEPMHRSFSETTSRREEEETNDDVSHVSPTPTRRSRRSLTPPGASLDEIPFGNSAFSVLDLPVGAEAGNTRRPPKRNNSFAKVPKVLKRVYNEGLKMVQETAEPPRGGPNDPPSIESWLHGTGDPFVDKPSPPASVLDIPEPSSRPKSYTTEDQTKQGLTAEHDDGKASLASLEEEDTPISNTKNRETLPSMEKSSPLSPSSGLRRSTATRNTSSPRSGKKTPLKAAIFGAFQGESAMKKPAPSPYDFIGLHERDINRTSSRSPPQESKMVAEESTRKVSPRSQERKVSEPMKENDTPPPPTFQRRYAPTTGVHRLSTIASVETLSTRSSASTLSQTASDLSDTTVTKDTALTQTTTSSLSRKSTKSKSGREGLKRRLTKHSDLMSMLSLPDTTEAAGPGRAPSIRSARSVRTSRTNLESTTVEDLLRELAEDEIKYMRVLNTLVDGVIPVLLTSVVSKSDTAIAAGLYDPLASSTQDTSKPIVDMGIALEKLKSLHRRMPTSDATSFLYWLQSADKTYQDYLRTWRSGFEDVVITLAPALASTKADMDLERKTRTDKKGHAIAEDGERVVVADLLMRPLIRVKKFLRLAKGFDLLQQSEMAKLVLQKTEELDQLRQRVIKNEKARKEDLKACKTDTTRARNPTTLAPEDAVSINRAYQVTAKDIFRFDMQHSTGQKLAMQVELIMRGDPFNKDSGDVLICEDLENSKFLLFPPQDRHWLSARIGDTEHELVVLMRGFVDDNEWREVFVLVAEDPEAVQDWISMLGSSPLPPQVTPKEMFINPAVASIISTTDHDQLGTQSILGELKKVVPDEAPIGERARRHAEEPTTPRGQLKAGRNNDSSRQHHEVKGLPTSSHLHPVKSEGPVDYIYKALGPEQIESCTCEFGILDSEVVNSVLQAKGCHPFIPSPKKRNYPSKYAQLTNELARFPVEKYTGEVEMSSGLSPVSEKSPSSTPNKLQKAKPIISDQVSPGGRQITPETTVLKKSRPNTPEHNGLPPPPPAHRVPVSPEPLKSTPVLDASTPKARNRLTSSPLKHEYRPSDVSGESSGTLSSDDYTSGDESYTDDSSDESEVEKMIDAPISLPTTLKESRKVSPNGSIYSFGGASLAPSNSASQGPFKSPIESITPPNAVKFVAMVSYWNTVMPCAWIDISPEPCSVVITPGNIEVFSIRPPGSAAGGASAEVPLVEQVLVPWVSARLSNAIDVEIGSAPTSRSTLEVLRRKKIKVYQFRYRTLTTNEGAAFYAAVDHARVNNPRVLADQAAARFNPSGGRDAYGRAVAKGRRRSFLGISLGRRKSYRAPARDQSEAPSTPSSASSGAISRLRRLSGVNRFNINASTLDITGGGSGNSSEYSGSLTPPGSRTPTPSGSLYSAGTTKRDMGFQNIPFRLYEIVTTNWYDHGQAFLTVLDPGGRRATSTLDHGPAKRIIITKHPFEYGSNVDIKGNPIQLFRDEVIGRDCFKRMGRVGVAFQVFMDQVGDDGAIGFARSRGGVGARQKLFCVQMGRAGDAEWVYELCTSGQGH